MRRWLICLVMLVLLVGCANGPPAYQPNEEDVAYDVGKLAVWAAWRTDTVNKIELEAVRPYLVYVYELLSAEPTEASVVLASIIEAEADRWGGGLAAEDRRIVTDVTATFLRRLRAEEPTVDEKKAAAVAAATLRGMLDAIDLLLE